MEKCRKDIQIRVADPTGRKLESGQFVFSGIVVVDDEPLAHMTWESAAVRYDLCNVPNAATKWARVAQHAEAMLEGAFAPLDEFLGALLAKAMEASGELPHDAGAVEPIFVSCHVNECTGSCSSPPTSDRHRRKMPARKPRCPWRSARLRSAPESVCRPSAPHRRHRAARC